MSWYDRVIWSEGLFLRPQHFQQQDRCIESLLEARAGALLGYGWGFRKLEINSAALALGKVEISSARGILPDGTPFDFPQKDPSPLALDIDANMKDERVVLALPLQRQGTRDVAEGGGSAATLARYAIGEMELTDTHTSSVESAPVQVGRLNLRLLRLSDVTDAYATIGVANIIERRVDNQLILDASYIPPTLSIGDNPILRGYVRELVGLLIQRGNAYASNLTKPGRGGVAEVAEFLILQTINRWEPLFRHFATHSLLHPERLYCACIQLAGDLDTFHEASPRALTPPEYAHDALAQCFQPVMEDLRFSLSKEIMQDAIPLKLLDRNYGVWLAMVPDATLYKSSTFVLAVNAQVPPDALRTRFPSQVKITPPDKLKYIVNSALPGIPLRPLAVAPRQIPFHAGFTYFGLEPGGELWGQLEKSGGIAMHIPGDFPGLELEFWAIRNRS